MLENKYQGIVVKLLKEAGAEILNLHGHAMQAPGWPDLYVAHRIWTGWIELKVDDNDLRPNQVRVVRALRERHVPVHVCRMDRDGEEWADDEPWFGTGIDRLEILKGMMP